MNNFLPVPLKRFVPASLALCAAVALLAPCAANATPITFTGSGTAAGNPVSASAQFSISGDFLTIVLTNTAPSHTGQDKPGSTLTGLFFDLTGNPTLSSDSATVTAGSSIIQSSTCNPGPCTGATNVGGEFGYGQNGQDGNAFPSGLGSEGIASAGYLTTGLAHNLGNFNGSNLDNPKSLDGINFGIVSENYAHPNGGLAGSPLIQDSVTFVLDNVLGLDESDISNVSFQYGTGFSEANIPGTPIMPVPEPAVLGMFGVGLLLLGGFATLRQRRQPQD